MNRKGFTLIELLAVLVILGVIAVIALPSINSSMQRTKVKQNDSRIKLIESYAEVYVNDHKNVIYQSIHEGDSCYISISTLVDEGYLSDDMGKDIDKNDFSGFVKFTRSDVNTFEYEEKKTDESIDECDKLSIHEENGGQ